MAKTLFILVICHLIGDYFLQSDFIAKTKGRNWYHLFVHCILYVVPFCIAFGLDLRLVIIFISHVIIDALKARYHAISYLGDQVIHYVIMIIYLVWR